MGITVKEALSIGGLKNCKVVAGEEGLHKRIDHVTVMEIPDVVGWLKGNDFLLTTLFPIKDDEKAISELISKLNASGSSVLAVKNSFFDEFPEVLISEANRLNFPVIQIDKEVSYLEIITPLMQEILREGSSDQDNIEEFFKWITELALGGKGLSMLVQAVESFLGNPISIESEIPMIKEVKEEKVERLSLRQVKELVSSKRAVRMIREINHKEIPSIVVPILLNEEPYGYFTCWEINRKFKMVDVMVLERLVSLFALEFLKVKTKLDVEQEYKSDFLYEILIGQITDEDELIDKARLFNWNLNLDYQVAVLDIDNFSSIVGELNHDELLVKEFKNKILNKVKKIMKEDYIVTLASDRIIILVPFNNKAVDETKKFFSKLNEKIKEDIREVSFTIGIGRLYAGIEGIHQGFDEALKAVKIGRLVWGKGQLYNFNDLDVYRLFTQISDKEELTIFYNKTIKILLDYDQSKGTDLFKTISEYYKNNYSLSETAKSLFIHVNTLKYRLQKVELLTSLSINSAEDRLKLHIGLKIKNIL